MTAPAVGAPIRIRELELLRRSHVTPAMVRVVLGGPGIAGFESHRPDEHVKVVFPDPDTGTTRPPVPDGDRLAWPSPMPPTRDLTVRHHDEAAGELHLDVVLHADGLASDWATGAEPGCPVWVAGPRPTPAVPDDVDFVVLVADESGLPAVARWLAELAGTQSEVSGVAIVEVSGPEEQQDLVVPPGVTVTWLHRDGAGAGDSALLGRVVRDLELPSDVTPYVWAGAEAGSVAPVRDWSRTLDLPDTHRHVAGYWRRDGTPIRH